MESAETAIGQVQVDLFAQPALEHLAAQRE
jgi:hypothetical protein